MAGEEDYESFDAPPTTAKDGRPLVDFRFPVPRHEGASEEDYETFDSKDIAAAPATHGTFREVGPGEAAVHGYVDLATYGLAPAIAGLTEAGKAPGGTGIPAAMEGVPSEAPGGEAIGEGLSRLWHDHFDKTLSGQITGEGADPQAHKAYTQGRESVLNDQNLAWNQHLLPYLAGQVGAALSMPGTLGRAAFTAAFGKLLPRLVEGVTGRIGGAALTGGTQAAIQGTGQAVSEGRPEDIPKEAAKGFGTGAVLGTAGSTVMEAAGKVASKVKGIVRGQRDTDAEAGRRIIETFTGKSSFSPEEEIEAAHAGIPVGMVDLGQTRTRALARSAANTSAEARQALESLTGAGEESGRFQDQGTRIGRAIRRLFGRAEASTDMETLERAARAVNKPLYRKAYAAGDRPIWDNPRTGANELEKLASTDSVAKAIRNAAVKGKDKAIADDVGMGAFRPSISVDSQGGVQFTKGPTGVPTYPNLQFWDYVQREMKDQIGSLLRNGEKDEAGTVKTLRDRLLKELDDQVPEFRDARRTAATFFGAEDALEAGQKFVMTGEDIPGAVRALARMSAPERELFARGFASDLADKVEKVGYDRNVLNSIFLNNGPARRKIQIALGPERADQLEALLRAEAIVDKARKALLGSTTARQLAESGLAGGGAVAAYETLKGEDFNPGAILAGALGTHGLRKGLHKIDQKVAQRVGEMLASDDVSQLQRGLQVASKSPTIMNALRAATGAIVRAGAPDVGFENVAAGATIAAEDIGDIFKKKEHHKPEHETENLQYQDQTQ